MQKNLSIKKPKKELKLQDIFNILKEYKWFILFIVLTTTLLSYIYIYFQPPIYNSYSIIKVKANKELQSEDVINSTTASVDTKDVIEEITLLKTFKINSRSLDRVNFNIAYFIDDGYRKKEIFGESVPIDITNIKILDSNIIGKMLTLTPTQKGYTISYTLPYTSKLKKMIFKSNEFTLPVLKSDEYNNTIKNQYFELTVNKKHDFSTPIHFVLHGNKRDIFEHMIHNRLDIIQLEHDTSLIKINFQDTIPKRANLYVDALTKSFIDYSIESKNAHNSKTLNFITQELKNIKRDLKKSEEKLEKQQIAKNIVKPSEEARLYIKNLSNIEIQISENKLKRKLISNLINFVQENDNLDAIAPSVSRLKDNNTLELIKKLQELRVKEGELTLEYTDEFPQLRTIRQQIATIKNQIEYNLKSLKESIDYENRNLLKQQKAYENDMKKLPSKERELVNIKRNYEVKSKMYEYLLKKQAENKIIQLATFSNYQIIDDAYNSNIPIKPKKSLILILSIFLGLLVGSALAFIRYNRNNYIQNKDELENITSLPIYGSIPYLKQSKNRVYVNREAKSPFTESYRTLRTNLQFVSKKNSATTILITSTVAGEGKSTTSANLATILEMAKYKTILVNFDLRKPTIHKFFDVDNNIGISNFLSEEKITVDDITRTTEFANLDIIPSGPIPSDPSELILSKKLPTLFKELKEKYEYIIIDTAPIGIVSDTKTLMQYTDLNLIIIREDYAKKDFIDTLEEIVKKHNFKNIGLILNASKAKDGEYGYGYSYDYKS